MNLATIAILCQVVGVNGNAISYKQIQKEQLSCQKYYINCFNKKQEDDFNNSTLHRHGSDLLLSECVLERK